MQRNMGLIAVLFFIGYVAMAGAQDSKNEIQLIVRGDDIGSCHAANVACIQCYREGIVRSVEVMVPAPWFNEAVKMLAENPQLDVGVHLDLTSEWEYYKWGPITHAPSLVDEMGHFFPMTSPNKNFPPHSSFMEARAKIEEVEKELRAQIELAIDKIANVTHLSAHMGTPVCTPELKALTMRLADEYDLPLEAPAAKYAGGFGGSEMTPQEKESALCKILENLKPGLWLFIDHPGLDTPEMRSIGHEGYRNVAADRDGVTKAFTSEKVKSIIQKRSIRLMSYGELNQKE
ncbi:MAG: polysaccharide deacetylase family protein [Candidatus Omnitrophota bacterium]